MAQNKFVKYGVYFIELLILHVLGQSFNVTTEFAPVLILPALIAISLLESDMVAVYFGFIGGMFLDISSGAALGVNAILLCLLCPMVSLIAKKKRNIGVVFSIIVGLGFIIIFTVYTWLTMYVLNGYSHPLTALISLYVPKYLYTFLLVPIAYLINLGISMGMRHPKAVIRR